MLRLLGGTEQSDLIQPVPSALLIVPSPRHRDLELCAEYLSLNASTCLFLVSMAYVHMFICFLVLLTEL